jgi:AraC-like DNA-binding protein
MYGYKLKINSLPKLVWACETTLNNYEWKNRNSKDMLEIAFAKFNTKYLMTNNNSYTLKKSALSCVMANERREAFCEPESPITIVSVAVKFSDFMFEPCELTEADSRDKTKLLLPAYLEDLPLSDELDLIKTLHKIIKLTSNNSENENVAFISNFFELLYKIDLMTRNKSGSKNQNNNYYIKKINYIIESKYSEKITLQSVASELNISPIYLSTMYKDCSGINFSEQLLNVRMKHAEKLLIDRNIPTSKVAVLCGFCDESYFRKKFKQFFGMNVREYRQIKNGFTLYHEKPQRKSPV